MSSSSTSSYYPYGENIVTNGDFNGNADGWVLTGGMTYESYHVVALPSGSYVKKASQYLSDVLDTTYIVTYEVYMTGSATTSFSLGNKFVSHGSNQGVLSSVILVEDYQPLIINATVASGKIFITNVSVREVLHMSSSSSMTSVSTLSSSSTDSSTLEKTTSSSVSSVSSSTQILSSTSSISSPSTSQTLSITSASLSSQSSSTSVSYTSASHSSGSSAFQFSSMSSSSVSSVSSSSQSSISSSSISSPSSSSFSSSSLSSLSTDTTGSSASTEFRTTSSSQSSLSSLSSSSSAVKGYCLLPFSFEVDSGKIIWSFARNENYVYAGTGPLGKIIRSKDYGAWETFQTVVDSHVRSLFIWANGLFAGTQPSGKIYVYNFSTDNFYNIVQTEDSCVTCFAEYNGKLYAGTSPLGVLYSFDGLTWTREYQAYGNGINSMSVYGNALYIFMNNAETAIRCIGSKFEMLKIKGIKDTTQLEEASSESSSASVSQSSQSQVETAKTTQNKETFASFRNTQYEPLLNSKSEFLDRISFTILENELGKIDEKDLSFIYPSIGAKSILSSCSNSSGLYIGSNNGIVFQYANNTGSVLYQNDEDNVNQILPVGDNNLLVAIDNKLYQIDFLQEN